MILLFKAMGEDALQLLQELFFLLLFLIFFQLAWGSLLFIIMGIFQLLPSFLVDSSFGYYL
jgi:hypothetical protein